MFCLFLCFCNVVFFVVVKNKKVQNYKYELHVYDAFLMGKDSMVRASVL